mgnify:FL=1
MVHDESDVFWSIERRRCCILLKCAHTLRILRSQSKKPHLFIIPSHLFFMDIDQGAEAVIRREGAKIIKDRVEKSYRHPSIDQSIRQHHI